jgi:hypothetical protein
MDPTSSASTAGQRQAEQPGPVMSPAAGAKLPNTEVNAAMDALWRRVEQLERVNQRWQRVVSGVLAALALVVFVGAASSKKAKSPAEVRAQRLVLVDKADKERAELTLVADDQPTLILADNAAIPRLTLALSKFGEPTLSFADASRTRRLMLSLDLYGTLLRLADDAGNPRATLLVPSTGEPEMALMGKDNTILWQAP